MNSSRIYGLDVLRALAIILVVISHSKPILFEFISKDYEVFLRHLGLFGVEIFFVLSGFLIGRILIKKILEKDVTKKTLYNFWMKRWFRTLPLYIFFLLVNFYIYIYLYQREFKVEYLGYFIFVQNFASPHPGFMPEAWSLSVEEWFYIITPIVLFSSIAIFKNYFSKEKILLVTITVFLILLTLNRWIYVELNNPEFGQMIRKIVIFRLDALIFGVLLAYLFIFYEKILVKYKNLLFYIGLSIFLYFYLGLVFGMQLTIFIKSFFFSFIDLAFALMLTKFYFIRQKDNTPSIMSYIAIISYSAYLSHLLIIDFLQKYFPANGDAMLGLNKFSALIILIFIISSLTYYLIEKPFMKLRNRLIKE